MKKGNILQLPFNFSKTSALKNINGTFQPLYDLHLSFLFFKSSKVHDSLLAKDIDMLFLQSVTSLSQLPIS